MRVWLEASGDITRRAATLPENGEGEAALWHAFRVGGSADAREKLFALHRAFARQVAAKHFLDRKSGDLELNDLCQFAYTGLLEAIDRFDPARGAPFRAYARRRISGSVLDGLAHLSERREQLSFRQRARRDRLKSLTIEDADKLGAADAMLALIEMATGLAHGYMIEGGGMYLTQDQADSAPSPYESVAWREMTRSLAAEISSLPDQERRVVSYHYLEGMSFEQVSGAFGLSKGRISQIHRGALRTLKERLTRKSSFSLEK